MYLPADHKCAIRQGFAASLLLTHIFFFLDFWWNFWAQMRREWGSMAYIGGRAGRPMGGGGATGPPCRPWVGPQSPGGGDRPPCPHAPPARDLFANLKKKITLRSCRPWLGRQDPVAPGRATGGHFRNFSKRTYIFEILIFFNIKKKKVIARGYISPGLQSGNPSPKGF